jgi:outer membrane protein OmpA-like peptidoglycan-associated protein
MHINRPRHLGTVILTLLLGAFATLPAHSEDLSKEELLKQLECRAGQDCQPPPTSRRRGFQPGRRGFTFEPFTEEERNRLDQAAKAGKLPSADVEIYFDFDKVDITAGAQKTLAPLGEALIDAKLASNRFVLVGHTDAKGSDAYNQTLSERRAQSVKDYLVRAFGIAPDRLATYGRGKSALKNTADPFAAENRRVQVINQGAMAEVDRKP